MLHGTETIPCVRDEPGEIAAVCSSDVHSYHPLHNPAAVGWSRAHLTAPNAPAQHYTAAVDDVT